MFNKSSIRNLIEKWQTIRGFANDVGCSYEAARKMRDRNSIAPRHWGKVLCAAKAKGVEWATIDWLISIHSRPPCGANADEQQEQQGRQEQAEQEGGEGSDEWS